MLLGLNGQPLEMPSGQHMRVIVDLVPGEGIDKSGGVQLTMDVADAIKKLGVATIGAIHASSHDLHQCRPETCADLIKAMHDADQTYHDEAGTEH